MIAWRFAQKGSASASRHASMCWRVAAVFCSRRSGLHSRTSRLAHSPLMCQLGPGTGAAAPHRQGFSWQCQGSGQHRVSPMSGTNPTMRTGRRRRNAVSTGVSRAGRRPSERWPHAPTDRVARGPHPSWVKVTPANSAVWPAALRSAFIHSLRTMWKWSSEVRRRPSGPSRRGRRVRRRGGQRSAPLPGPPCEAPHTPACLGG